MTLKKLYFDLLVQFYIYLFGVESSNPMLILRFSKFLQLLFLFNFELLQKKMLDFFTKKFKLR